MQIKKYLQGIRQDYARIESLRAERDALHDKAFPGAIRYDTERVQTSGTADRTGDIVVATADLDAEIESSMSKYIHELTDAIHIINQLSVPIYSQVLTEYYLSRVHISPTRTRPSRWAEVAERMGYSESYILNIHGAALQAADPIYQAYKRV